MQTHVGDPSPVNAPPAATGSSFYTAMRVLPLPQRRAMFAIYDFCRAVDDVADGDGAREARLADHLGRVGDGGRGVVLPAGR